MLFRSFNLLKAGAIDNESLLDLLEPPMKQLLKEKLRKREAMKAAQQQQQPEQPPQKKPDLKAVGE